MSLAITLPFSLDGAPCYAAVTARTPRVMSELDRAMERFLDGDIRGFDALYRAMAPRVRGLLRALCGDPRLAEDLVQTTFLKIHAARETFHRGAPVEPWVFAIARRTYLDQRRRTRRRPEDLSADGVLPERVEEAAAEGFDRLDPEVAATLQRELDALPPAQREAVVLLKMQDLSVNEAAAVAGVTPSALKVRAHRGYEALRRALGLKP
ncbi:MAG: RNA polymerase sigma factor [Polyangiales bacterium]